MAALELCWWGGRANDGEAKAGRPLREMIAAGVSGRRAGQTGSLIRMCVCGCFFFFFNLLRER